MKLDPLVDRLVTLALEEDLSLGDVTTDATVSPSIQGVGAIKAKEDLVFFGRDVSERVFRSVDSALTVTWLKTDGDAVSRGEVVATVTGSVATALMAERTVLNFVQRLSGVATLSRRFVEAVAGTGAQVVDTRKTTPGWRTLEKAAVAAGGARNHRFSLGSGVLIKDNHVDAGGGVAATIEAVRATAPHGLRIEVEVRTLDELRQAIDARADVVLLDNMSLATLKAAVEEAHAAQIITEASGGVTLQTVRAIAETGVQYISVGALTHSAPSVDLNFKVKPS